MRSKLITGTAAFFAASGLLLAQVVQAAEIRQSAVACVDAQTTMQDGSSSTSIPATHVRAYRGISGIYNPNYSLWTTSVCAIPDSSYLYPDAMRTLRLTGFDASPTAAVSAFIYVAYAGGQGGKSLKKLYSGGTQMIGAEAQPSNLSFTGKFDLNFVYYGQPSTERITSANRSDTKLIVLDIPPAGASNLASRASEFYFSTDYYFGT